MKQRIRSGLQESGEEELQCKRVTKLFASDAGYS
jgi:hypothetical protein